MGGWVEKEVVSGWVGRKGSCEWVGKGLGREGC